MTSFQIYDPEKWERLHEYLAVLWDGEEQDFHLSAWFLCIAILWLFKVNNWSKNFLCTPCGAWPLDCSAALYLVFYFWLDDFLNTACKFKLFNKKELKFSILYLSMCPARDT